MKNKNFGIRDLLEIYSEASEKRKLDSDIEGQLHLMLKYFDARSDEAKSLLKERMTEVEIVQLLSVLQLAVLSAMAVEGKGGGLMLALASEDLDGFTHTLCLTFLGIAIDEELI